MTTKAAWNVRPAVSSSFAEVMNEEYARKLVEEEHKDDAVPDEEMDEDLRLALELSKLEAEDKNNVNKEEPAAVPLVEQVDSDFALALQLQNEIDAARHERQARVHHDPLSKVSYTYDDGVEYIGADSSEEEEELDDEEEELLRQLQENPFEVKPYHEAVKTGGRVPAKEITTKHDALVSGLRNAENLERNMSSGNMEDASLSNPVYNALREEYKRKETSQNRVRGNRLDKSTSEQVLDQRTRVTLLKMLNSGVLSELHGVISTGKEANVYHALAGSLDQVQDENREYAIKIYKTTLNEFKNRTEYIEGEFRFRHSSKNNPRKLIKLWAEKEMRNLKRLQAHDIPCPTPVLLRENLLIMHFIGKNGFPSPCLKDVELNEAKALSCYLSIAKTMRNMYQKCKLVHADLSEYNILYHKGQIWIIDVSQSVENDHPKALEFLRKDVNAITSFFKKRGVENALSPRDLFNFVTDMHLKDDQVDNFLEQAMKQSIQRVSQDTPYEDQLTDALFQSSYIPRTLHAVPSPVKEIFENQPSFHHTVTGLKPVKQPSIDSDSDNQGEEQTQ